MDYIETEVKFLLLETETVKKKLTEIGAVGNEPVFETNYRYDDHHATLRKKHAILRLRKDEDILLTLKSRPADQENHDFKIHHELEVTVSDFNTMDRIIENLGYHRVQIYEKWRQTYKLDDTLFCIDTLPFGTFLEIEGSQEAILKMTETLSLDWKNRILISYLELFNIVKTKKNLTFNDITFDNFRNLSLSVRELHSFFLPRPEIL